MTYNDVITRHAPVVELVQHVGSDAMIAAAAKVSTGDALDPEKISGLISYLMTHRHGSPFEHGSLTFQIDCPIFVAREFMRHRIGWSYSELSGRYSELAGGYWLPLSDRPLVNAGTSARPRMERGSEEQYELLWNAFQELYASADAWYRRLLKIGVAREVARSILPVGTYTSFHATCNPRSLMHFLSLRVDSPDNAIDTYPQLEIQQVAEQMEAVFAHHWPMAHAAFVANGRIAP